MSESGLAVLIVMVVFIVVMVVSNSFEIWRILSILEGG